MASDKDICCNLYYVIYRKTKVLSTSSDVINFHVIKNTGISPTEDIGRGYKFFLPKKKLMTSDAYGFGQLNKQISFLILYAQLLTMNACMASVEIKSKDVQHQCRQTDWPERR